MIDMHCHILPGVDDGARDLHESLIMAKKLVDLGFDCICATPHLPWPDGPGGCEELAARCRALQEAVRGEGLPVRILLAAEHHVSVVLDLLANGGLVCYPRGDSFLMEFSHAGLPPRVDELLFRVQVKRMIPVIAHAERYPEVQADPSVVDGWKQRGARVLINLSGLGGEWGREAQRTARSLLERGLVDAANSDLHGPGGLDVVRLGLARLRELVGDAGSRALLVDNPAEICGTGAAETGA